MTDKELKKLIEREVVGFEIYPPKQQGGQIAGMPIIGARLWFPKQDTNPMIDIRISSHRSQFKNRELAVELFKLAMEES